jgi:hypothetical protein
LDSARAITPAASSLTSSRSFDTRVGTCVATRTAAATGSLAWNSFSPISSWCSISAQAYRSLCGLGGAPR